MPKIYPDYPNPTMIFNVHNQYTIVDASDKEAFLAAGWLADPRGDIYTAPTEFPEEVILPEASPELAVEKPTDQPKKKLTLDK